ncbi:putative exported protein [Plasmodium reichenowi]|uniref:Putative exported protein n=1 Tax=Plasmodium reichenowi TaxID=5854 RepID=A0A151L635_PLARE|nr:putative exported protein [Plasmodium reichenowi]KYN94428.1 putative exported protein [Plasmodium reichenowi]
MHLIYLKILFFSLLLDTFISSHTNIPRTNNVTPKNVAINISPVGPIPDVITLDYIKGNLEQIQLIKDIIIKEKLKKLKVLKKKCKKNKKDKELKNEIENLEREIMDTRKLCNNYIKNEIKEIKSLKDQIIKDKIEKDRWKKDLLIDYELKRLMYKPDIERLKQLYEEYKKEELRVAKLKDNMFKIYQFILYLIPNTIYYTIEFVNNIPELELSLPKFLKKKKKTKSKSFFELWSSLYEILEEKVHKYQIGGYVLGFGLLSGIGKSIHSIVATPTVCIKYYALAANIAACKTKLASIAVSSANVVSNVSRAATCEEKLQLLNAACTAATTSPDPATKIVAIIIIVILVIILLVYLYYVIKKSGILENEHVQKVIAPIQTFFGKCTNKMKHSFKDIINYKKPSKPNKNKGKLKK